MTDLADRAILVSLHQRAWAGTVADRDLASRAEEAAHAEAGTLRVLKELTPRRFIQPITRIMALGRSEHYDMTLPGFTRGQHILPTKLMDRYMQVQSEVRNAFQSRVNDFLEIYPEIVENAPQRLSGAYKAEDFPSPQNIRSFFEYEIKFAPVPKPDGWILDGVGNADTDQLRNELTDEIRVVYNKATREVFERARAILSRIAQQARAYKGGPGSAQLRDATIENLKDISDLVLHMNITNDPVLAEVGKEMVKNFADCEAAKLRQSEETRNRIADAAEAILARIPK